MSRSESELVAGATETASSNRDQDIAAIVAALDQLAEAPGVSPEQVRSIVSAAIRLYAAASERAGRELPPVDYGVSTTDALTLACALVRSQDLTPFEMAVWFSRGPRAE